MLKTICNSITFVTKRTQCQRLIRKCYTTKQGQILLDLTKTDIGQPTPLSHPHLFKNESELTPGITSTEYAKRRLNLLNSICKTRVGKRFDRHVIIMLASDYKTMSNDIPFPFHQDVDFLYLTGINEADSIAVLEVSSPQYDSDKVTSFLLFLKPKDVKRELWDGPVIGEQAAVEYFKADESFPLHEFESVFKKRFGSGDYCVWLKNSKDINLRNEEMLKKILNSTAFHKKSLENVETSIQSLRLIKSSAEVEIMKQSATIGVHAFIEVMKNTQAGVSESNLHALLEYECRLRGAQFLSFPPVVAGGRRANTLHYINNDQILKDGDLVLMDGGCELNGYPCDITRTWPVNGKFTDAQKELYQIVLRVQKACLAECTFNVSINILHNKMLTVFGEELKDIGLISSRVNGDALQTAVMRFCPHNLGHYLGMDTHDTPMVRRSTLLEEGVAFTLEPGLYSPHNALDIDEKYRGIGIRIEDDVLMTESGPFVLTRDLPKEIDDIEYLLAESTRKMYVSK